MIDGKLIAYTHTGKTPQRLGRFRPPGGLVGLEVATMTFMSSYNIYEDKGNTEGDKAMSHPWKSRGTIVGHYEPQEEVPHGHA
ncbi:MAG: hypothetical protein QXN78_06895 [Conexivisphaerales archaeon]